MSEKAHQPLVILRYRLTLVDALAYERLPGEWPVWQKIAVFAPLIEEWPRL